MSHYKVQQKYKHCQNIHSLHSNLTAVQIKSL